MGSLRSVELKEGSNMRNSFEKKVQRSQYLAGKCDAHVGRQSAIHLPRWRSLCCSAGGLLDDRPAEWATSETKLWRS